MRADHPTKVALLSTTVELIDDRGVNGFTVETLLERSGISKGSLYHHYADFSAVIEAAQIARFARYVDEDIAALMSVLQSSSSREDLLERLSLIAKSVHHSSRRAQRADRAAIIGLARSSENFAQRLGVEQQRLTDALTDLVREGQNRGFINQGLNARALATFVQSYSLGKVLDDIVAESLTEEAWDALIQRIFTAIL
jgi:AcrR family transcriptional regulator